MSVQPSHNHKLDDADRARILKLHRDLVRSGVDRGTARVISDRLGISAPTIHKIINQAKRDGLIR